MLRDAILASISPLLSNCQNKEEVIKILAKRLPQINDLANQILVEAGSTHQAKVTLGEAYFPTKVYADLTFPCGNYDALKIEIGQACGHNWWCVMFPRLCFADLCFGYVPENEKDKLKDLITPEHFEQIKNANTTSPAVSAPLMIRFRIFDLISSLFH